MAETSVVTKALALLCCLAFPTACEAHSPEPSLGARTVIHAAPEQFCSVFVEDATPPARKDARIRKILSYVDRVKTRSPKLAVTYLDLQNVFGLTLSAPGTCAAASGTLAQVREHATASGLRTSAAFVPRVEVLPGEGMVSPRLSQVVQRLNGQQASLAACTMAVKLSPSSSADADARLGAALAKARDEYGFPLLFSVQKNNIMYISLYRQCNDLTSAFSVLRVATSIVPNQQIKMLGFEQASEAELHRIYGHIH